MRGKLTFAPFDENFDCFYTDVSIGILPYDYEICIKQPLDKSFEELISDPYDFEESIDCNLDVVSDYPDQVELLENVKKDRLYYLRNVSDITFKYEPKLIAEFVRKNPILSTKKIIFEDEFDLDATLLNKVREAFGKNTTNIYFKVNGNNKEIAFKEYEDTIITINNFVDSIKSFDFSPLETIMYVYDIVRDRIYKEVDENEDKMISRNLTSALLGDKIVCVGYAVIFSTLLNRLGIACDEVFLRQPGKRVGHARNVIRIKDDKYNVDGIYYFDPTWNSKKNKFDNNFMFSYRYFALTKEQMDEIDKGRIVDEEFPYFSNNMAQEFKKQAESVGLKNLPDDFVKSINFMALLVNGDSLFSKMLLNPYVPDSMKPNKDNIYESLLEIEKYFIKPITAETLIRVLFNVRKQEYYNNPEKYAFALIDFCKTVACSHWDYEGTPVEKLMMQLAETSEDKMKVNFHQSIRVANENNIPEQIEQVKLTRTLRSIYEQKINI